MMHLVLAIILLSAALLAYLLMGSAKTPHTTAPKSQQAHDKEIRALISQYEQDLAALAELPVAEKSTRQAELEARLYHELTPFTHPQQHIHGAPAWAYAVIVVLVASAIGAWYVHGGHFILQWQKLDHSMDSALMRSQFLDELPEQMPAEMLSTYCLALQNRIDRADLNQLDTLAQCVAGYGNYPLARQIYETIYRKDPENTDNVINYAQMSLFSEQGQALAPSIEAALQRIWFETPDNYMAGVLLASSYTQSGALEQAAMAWQQLAHTMPEDHPLYELVHATYQRMRHADLSAQSSSNATNTDRYNDTDSGNGEDTDNGDDGTGIGATSGGIDTNIASNTNTSIGTSIGTDNPPSNDVSAHPIELRIQVTIAQPLLDTLPSASRLFVLASPANSRMPIAVKRLPLSAQQTISLSDKDSMQGQTLAEYQQLTISAILSLDGQANGNIAQRLRKDIALDSSTSPIELSFDFNGNDTP